MSAQTPRRQRAHRDDTAADMATEKVYKTLDEMAADLGVEPDDVKRWVSRLRNRLFEEMKKDPERLGLPTNLDSTHRITRDEFLEKFINSDEVMSKAPKKHIHKLLKTEFTNLKSRHKDQWVDRKSRSQVQRQTPDGRSHTTYGRADAVRTRKTTVDPSTPTWAGHQSSPSEQISTWRNPDPRFGSYGAMHRTLATPQQWLTSATPQPWNMQQYGLSTLGPMNQPWETLQDQALAAKHQLATAAPPVPEKPRAVIVKDQSGLKKRFTGRAVKGDWATAYDTIVLAIGEAFDFDITTHRLVNIENDMVVDSNDELSEEFEQARDDELTLEVRQRGRRGHPQTHSRMDRLSQRLFSTSIAPTSSKRPVRPSTDAPSGGILPSIEEDGLAAYDDTPIASRKRRRTSMERDGRHRKRINKTYESILDSDDSDSSDDVVPSTSRRRRTRIQGNRRSDRPSIKSESRSEQGDVEMVEYDPPKEDGPSDPDFPKPLKPEAEERPEMGLATDEAFPDLVPASDYVVGEGAMSTLIAKEDDTGHVASNADEDTNAVSKANLEAMMSDLYTRSGLTAAIVKQCCTIIVDWIVETWNPSEPVVKLPGWCDDLPTNLQVISAFIMMFRQYESVEALHKVSKIDADKKDRPVGVVCGHEPGIGKTGMFIWMFVFRLHLIAMQRDVTKDRKVEGTSHLPEGAPPGSQCPSQGKPGRPPIRCMCEPGSETARLWAPEGLTVIVVPLVLIPNWDAEFDKFVDRKALTQATGIQVEVCVAHGKKSQLKGRLPDLGGLPRYHNTVNTWKEANPGNPDVEVILANRESEHDTRFRGLTRPARREECTTAGTGVFVITTPQSLESQVIDKTQCNAIPPIHGSVPCQSGANCSILKPKCNSRSHQLNGKSLPMPAFAFAEIGLDEAHMHPHKKQSRSILKKVFSDQITDFNFTPVCTPLTGTPHSVHPFEMMPFMLLHHCDEWKSHPQLKSITQGQVERAEGIFELMSEWATTKKLSAQKLKRLNIQLPEGPLERTERLKELWNEGGVDMVKLLCDCYSIEFHASDTWAGEPFHQLPGLEHSVLTLELGEYGKQVMRKHAPKWMQLSKRITALRLADVTDKAHQAEEAARGKEIKDVTRYLRFLCGMPYLDEILAGSIDDVLSKSIFEGGWFQNFDRSPFADSLEKLIETSPKLQYCIDRRLKAQRVDPNPKRASHNQGKSAERGKQNRRLVYVCYEPANAVILKAALELKCPGHTVRAIYRSKSTKDDMNERARTIAGFQDALVDGEWVTRVDSLVVCSRQGGTGLTLTGASEMIIFDVDPDIQRYDQVPKRIHRFGQKDDCYVVQLLTTDLGLEGFTWNLVRSKRKEAADAIPDMTLAMEALRKAGDSEADAILIKDDRAGFNDDGHNGKVGGTLSTHGDVVRATGGLTQANEGEGGVGGMNEGDGGAGGTNEGDASGAGGDAVEQTGLA